MLLERQDSLNQLHALLATAASGTGQVVLVRGEAGIGKTTLLKWFCDEVADAAHVLWGGCDDLVTAAALGPLWDIAAEETGLEAVLRDEDRNPAFRYVLDLLSRSLRPTVIVIEDVQWADEATLDLIRFIGRRIDRTHGLLVLSHRDGEGDGDDSIRMVLGDLPPAAVTRISVQALTRGAVAELAEREDVDEIVDLTGGNPFFVSEVIAHGEGDVPQSISDLVNARVGRLEPEARRLAEVVSVIPGKAELAVLRELTIDLADSIGECEQAGLLVVEGDAVRYRHELARRAVESGFPEITRRELNREVLSVLEKSAIDPGRLAHHALEAVDQDAMLRLLPGAARNAAALGSHREAVKYLQALQPYLDRMPIEELADHYDLWAWEESVLGGSRSLELAREALELQRRIGEPAKVVRALLNLGGAAYNIDGSGISFHEEALALSQELGDQLSHEDLAWVHAAVAQAFIMRSRLSESLMHAQKALALVGDNRNATRVEALTTFGSVLARTSYPDGVAELTDARIMAEELGLTREAMRAVLALATTHWTYGPFHAFFDTAEIGIAMQDKAEVPPFRDGLEVNMAGARLYAGEWEVALAEASRLLDRETLSVGTRFQGESIVVLALVRQGSPDAAGRALDLWKRTGHFDSPQFRYLPGLAISEIAWLEGRIEPELLTELRSYLESVPYPGAPPVIGLAAGLLSLGGWCKDLDVEMLPGHRSLIEGDWRTAADYFGEVGLPYEKAIALSHGDVEMRLEALRILDELGGVPLANRVRKSLQDEGVSSVPRGPTRVRRENPLGLTARQSEILVLLGEDLSNAEIADRLFLSQRTVEHHVSAILTALGASSRHQAVKMASESIG